MLYFFKEMILFTKTNAFYFFLNCDGEQPFLLLISAINPLASEKPTSLAIAVTDKSVFLSKLNASFKRSSF